MINGRVNLNLPLLLLTVSYDYSKQLRYTNSSIFTNSLLPLRGDQSKAVIMIKVAFMFGFLLCLNF